MDDIGGEPLDNYLARVGRLPVLQGLALALQLLDALEAMHRGGLAHGAIGPDRLLVSRTGRLLLPDPDGPGERRADLFAAAVVCYELLTGAAPFDGGAAGATGPAPRPVHAVRPELPQALDGVFQRALASNPERRHATAGELAVALQAALPAPRWAGSPACEPTRAEAPPHAVPVDAVPTPAPVAPSPASLPMQGAPAWQLGLALAAWAAVAFLASGLLRGTPAPAPTHERRVPVELAAHETGPAPLPIAVPAVLAGSLRPQAVPEPALAPAAEPVIALPAEPAAARPAEPAPLVDAAAPPHPRRATDKQHGAKPGAAPRHAQARQASSRHARPVAARGVRPGPPDPRAACGSDKAFASELCTAFRCATAEYRAHPVCVRMHAEGASARARLAELHGGP